MNRSVQETTTTSTIDEAPSRAAPDPLGSARAILELQQVAGNRAVGQLVAARRAGAPPPQDGPVTRARAALIARAPPTDVLEPPKEKPVWKPPRVSGPTSQKEFSLKRKIGTNKSFSFKITFARSKHTKVVKAGVEGERAKGSLSLWELKSVREQVGKDVAHKLQASLAQAEGTYDLVPGLIVKVNAKLLEYQLDRCTSESELNFLTVSGSIEGNITEWANRFSGIPEEERSNIKVTVAGEFKWTPSAGDLARLKEIWKQNDLIRREAKQVAESTKRLEKLDKRRNALDKELKAARKRADELRRKANKAKRPNLKRRYQQQVKKAERKIADLARRQGQLKKGGQELTERIVNSEKVMKEAGEKAAEAGAKMKGRLGRTVAKAIGKKTGKLVARFLVKAIPVINVLSTLYDLYEIGKELDKFLRGGKWDPFGGGEDSGGKSVEGGVEGATGTEPPVGSGSGADGSTVPGTEAAEGGSGGDAAVDARTNGKGAGGAAGGGRRDAGSAGQGTGKAPVTDTGSADAGTAGGSTGAIEHGPDAGAATSTTAPPGEAPVALHEQARAVYEIVKGKDVRLDPEHAYQLDSIVPATLSQAQLDELARRIEKLKGEGVEDPFEIIGRIHEEIERVVKGEPAVEVTIDAERRKDLSTPATPPVVPTEPAETTADGQVVTKDKGGSERTKTKAKAKPAKKKKKKSAAEQAPKSLMPSIPGGFFHWNDAIKEWVLPDDRREELLGTNWNLGGGLVVAVTDVQLSHEKTVDFTLGTVAFEVMVLDIPERPGKGYPWKIGDTRSYTERVAMDRNSGKVLAVTEEAGGQQAFEDALSFSGGKFSLKRDGATVRWPGATLRLDGLVGSGTLVGSGKDADIYAVTLLVTPTAVSDPNAGVVTGDGPVRFRKGEQVKVRLELSIAKQPARAP